MYDILNILRESYEEHKGKLSAWVFVNMNDDICQFSVNDDLQPLRILPIHVLDMIMDDINLPDCDSEKMEEILRWDMKDFRDNLTKIESTVLEYIKTMDNMGVKALKKILYKEAGQ